MDDRTLLERAARAAGIELDWEPGVGEAGQSGPWRGDKCSQQWNPINDDGDALRLAVRLRISPYLAETPPDEPEAGIAVPTERGPRWDYFSASGECPYAATRRAIVMAAAAMAKE